jgi:hypothetical protein
MSCACSIPTDCLVISSVDLLLVAHPADEDEQVEVFPPGRHAMLGEEVVEVGEDFRFEVHARAILSKWNTPSRSCRERVLDSGDEKFEVAQFRFTRK